MKKEESTVITASMVMAQRPTPRETYTFIKGDFTRHGDVVTAAVPAMLPQIIAANPTRLDLARWLTDPRNPLTARVTVNQIWQHYFGLGLVETENDFGTQGTPPSNPQLLDWLAKEFVNQSTAARSASFQGNLRFQMRRAVQRPSPGVEKPCID